MPAVDRIASVVTLVGLGGLLVLRAVRAWADYRVQRRAVDLLVRSVTEVERPKPRERRR
jgi:hypothetical protein